MKKSNIITIAIFLLCLITFNFTMYAKPKTTAPKLVIGIVVDQMRWDFLYRYSNRYSNNGFKRLMNEGFNCENTFIPYFPTVTAAGHTCIYTGSVPNIHGIVGNNWYENNVQKYCTQDDSVQSIGTTTDAGKMSPKNMLVTTVCDELKLATNFKSKVFGVAIKDRGAILPAGHSANAAYWYDSKIGNFITSSYYQTQLPQWVINFNNQKLVEKYYQKNWQTLYPIATYTQSDTDQNNYENTPFGKTQKSFPYSFDSFISNKKYGQIRITPYGNSITLDLSKSIIENEHLGEDNTTDFLTVSLSSTDYIGHAFGPNSIEIEDTYLRLDKDIADFLNYLDKKIGKNNYTLFLTADHGVAHIPAFLEKHKLPNGNLVVSESEIDLNKLLTQKFGADSLIVDMNNQIFINKNIVDKLHLNFNTIKYFIMDELKKDSNVQAVYDYANLPNEMITEKVKQQYINGYFEKRCGDILYMLKPNHIDDEYDGKGTTHGVWNPYDSHIPLLFYGKNIKKGKTYKNVYMTDIAPTIASILQIQMPSGCIGNTILEVLDK